MKEPTTVHLDTSIQMERCKTAERSKRIDTFLQPFASKTTSSYARLEFLRAWIQRLALLHGYLGDANNLNEVMQLLEDRLKSPNHVRRYKTLMQALFACMETSHSSNLDSRAALIRVRKHIQERILGWNCWWDNSITSTYNGTQCVRSTIRPKVRTNGDIDAVIPVCIPNKVNCCVDQFFTRKKIHFESISDAIASEADPSEGLKNIRTTIERSKVSAKVLLDDKVCRRIGDAIIAVDSGSTMDLAANNDAEWRLLSRVLKKRLHNPVNARESEEENDDATCEIVVDVGEKDSSKTT